MVPRQIGETQMEAVGDSRRYRPRGLLGGGAEGSAILIRGGDPRRCLQENAVKFWVENNNVTEDNAV
jgi:hypothetical protein